MRMSMVEDDHDLSNSSSSSSYYDTSSSSWQDQLASLVETRGIQYHYQYQYQYPPSPDGDGDGDGFGFGSGFGVLPPQQLKTSMDVVETSAAASEEVEVEVESLKDQVNGFLKASAEMVQQLCKGCKDVVHQSVVAHAANTYFASKCSHLSPTLSFFNDFLPEDRHPLHAWPIIFSVFFIALAVLTVNNAPQNPPSTPKKVYMHPPSATRVQLPDGRHMAYYERGVPAKSARFSMVSPHSFLSSRLAGIPGIKETLLEEFGVRLITYDLPGFGESDPHPNRDLNTSAMDMLCLADAVGINDKFWVVGYSGGGMHAWAALSYIPDRLAGAAMFAPIVNPYDSSMTKEEKLRIWEKWTRRRKLMYFLARRFPFLLTYFYRRSFLSGAHGQLDKWLSLSLGKKDRSLIAEHIFEEFWQRDVEESVRQGHIKPFIEEAFLQVSNWGFSLADIRVQKKRQEKGILPWLKSMYSQAELEWAGFLGPIHIWQGMDDQVVTPSTAEFVSRLVPRTTLHKLEGEGHLSFFWFCDECHRQIMLALFGEPRGPLTSTLEEVDVTSSKEQEESDEVLVTDPET